MVVGCWLLVFGCWLVVFGRWSLVFGQITQQTMNRFIQLSHTY